MVKGDFPINYSELIKFTPPDEKILYSTLLSAGTAISQGERVVRTWTLSFLTHVLITPLGISYFCKPYNGNTFSDPYEDPLPTYNSLLNILSITKRGFMLCHIDPIARAGYPYQFEMVQGSDETKEQYKARLDEFKLILLENIKNAADHMLNYIEENKDKEEKNYSPLWKLNKSLLVDNLDQHLHEFINYSDSIQEVKNYWEQAKIDKKSRSTRDSLRTKYVSLLKETLRAFAYKEGNIGYLRPIINYDAELNTYFHLHELQNRMKKYSDYNYIRGTGVTPTTNSSYRSIFHNKATKKLLKIKALAEKKILKLQNR